MKRWTRARVLRAYAEWQAKLLCLIGRHDMQDMEHPIDFHSRGFSCDPCVMPSRWVGPTCIHCGAIRWDLKGFVYDR